MSKKFRLLLLSFVLTASANAQGPNDGFIMGSEGMQHVIHHPDPVYPPIAKAAHVQGSVLLHVTVDATGKVTKVEAIGGPPMLKGAAIEAVGRWSYRPFLVDGKPSTVQVVVSLPFSLGIPSDTEKSDQGIAQAYFPKSDECRAANAQQRWEDAVKLCAELVAIADRFPDPASRANEIRGAHQSYGHALSFNHQLPQALEQCRIAVAIAQKSLTPEDAEYASVFFSQAFAEHSSRMNAEADRDYSIAEDSYRKAIVNLPDMKKQYGYSLAHTLAFHSILLQQTGDPVKAKAMQQEALTFDPHSLDGLKGSN